MASAENSAGLSEKLAAFLNNPKTNREKDGNFLLRGEQAETGAVTGNTSDTKAP